MFDEEFQFSVSHEGRFVFRTEWMHNSEAAAVQIHLVAAFQAEHGYKVRRNTRNATFKSEQVN